MPKHPITSCKRLLPSHQDSTTSSYLIWRQIDFSRVGRISIWCENLEWPVNRTRVAQEHVNKVETLITLTRARYEPTILKATFIGESFSVRHQSSARPGGNKLFLKLCASTDLMFQSDHQRHFCFLLPMSLLSPCALWTSQQRRSEFDKIGLRYRRCCQIAVSMNTNKSRTKARHRIVICCNFGADNCLAPNDPLSARLFRPDMEVFCIQPRCQPPPSFPKQTQRCIVFRAACVLPQARSRLSERAGRSCGL